MYQNSMPYVGGCRTSGGPCDPKRVILIYHTRQTTIYNTIYKLLSVCLPMYKSPVYSMYKPPFGVVLLRKLSTKYYYLYLHIYCLVP